MVPTKEKINEKTLVRPPRSWRYPAQHFMDAMTHPWYRGVSRLYDSVIYASFVFFKTLGHLSVLLPITCQSVSSPMGLGSDSVPVCVDLFSKKTYLSDSMQFYLEYLLRNHKKGVYYVMPSFRGEDPDERHLNQFFHFEAELPVNLEGLLPVIENYLRFITRYIVEKNIDQLKTLIFDDKHIKRMLKNDEAFPRIKFSEIVKEFKGNEKLLKEILPNVYTLTSFGERKILEMYNHEMLWVTHFDKMAVPFYQAIAEDKKYAKCADLLLGIGETIGCGERHLTGQQVIDSIREHQLKNEGYQWYIDMKNILPMLSSGFGMGIERYLLWLLNHDDIRDMSLISRLKNAETFV